MTSYKPLNIPARDREKGMNIFCGKCNTTVKDKCRQSGKKIYTCKHPDQHRYQTKAWDKSKGYTVPIYTAPKELRDFEEYREHHRLAMKKFKPGKPVSKKKKLPALLSPALKRYYDWLKDIDPDKPLVNGKPQKLPAQKIKNLSKKYVQNELNNLATFKESQPYYATILVRDITDDHVGVFHEYLEEHDYSPRTYNNKMESMRKAFKYFIECGYKISENPFSVDEVRRKKWKAKKDYIQPEDFQKLLDSVSTHDGYFYEGEKRVHLYREWLTDFWELALYVGGRTEDLSHIRFKDVEEHHIEAYDYKVSKELKEDVYHWIVRTREFNDLFRRLQERHKYAPDDFLIAPGDDRRVTIANHASKAYTHYARALNLSYYTRMYSLRKVHATLMSLRHGEKYAGVFGMHQNIKTTLENYANQKEMIKAYSGKSLFS